MLHTKSYVSSNGQLVDIERMKTKFLAFADEATNPLNFQLSEIQELSSADTILRRVSEMIQSKVARVDELTEMHDYWMIRVDNIHNPRCRRVRLSNRSNEGLQSQGSDF